MEWIVLRQTGDGAKRTFGPVPARTAEEAILIVAEGREYRGRFITTAYVPQKRGRYHAIPLGEWQSGTFDYTKARGAEAVGF